MMGINDQQRTIAYSDSPRSRSVLFVQSFRVVKLLRLLIEHGVYWANYYAQTKDNEISYDEHIARAEAELKKSITQNPTDWALHQQLFDLYFSNSQYRKAEQISHTLIRYYPDDVEPLFMLGLSYLTTGKFIKAEKIFKKALSYPNVSADLKSLIESLLSRSYLGQHRNAEAFAVLIAGTQERPDDIRPIIELGDYYIFYQYDLENGIKQCDAALLMLEKSDTIDRGLKYDLSFVFHKLGRLLYAMHDYARAEKYLIHAVDLNKTEISFIVELARTYRAQGKYSAAVQTFLQARTLEPDNIQHDIDYAIVLFRHGKTSDALSVLDDVLQKEPYNHFALLTKGALYLLENDYTKANRLFEFAQQHVVGNHNIYWTHITEMSFRFKRHAFLEQVVRAVLSAFNEIHPFARKGLGQVVLAKCLVQQERWSEVEKVCLEALQVDFEGTDGTELYGTLAISYLKQGKYDEAQKHYQQAHDKRMNLESPRKLATDFNYHSIINKVIERGSTFMSVQYPLRSVEPLKKMLAQYDDILFVENRTLFLEALKSQRYSELFIDCFAGDFGHCSPKGNQLIAESIASALEKYFKTNKEY